MTTCPACGKENEDSAFECKRCRAPLREEVPEGQAPGSEPAREQEASSEALGMECRRCEAPRGAPRGGGAGGGGGGGGGGTRGAAPPAGRRPGASAAEGAGAGRGAGREELLQLRRRQSARCQVLLRLRHAVREEGGADQGCTAASSPASARAEDRLAEGQGRAAALHPGLAHDPDRSGAGSRVDGGERARLGGGTAAGGAAGGGGLRRGSAVRRDTRRGAAAGAG